MSTKFRIPVTDEPVGPFQVVLLLLSIYAILVIYLHEFVVTDPDVQYILRRSDDAVCLLFLYDFFHRFFRAPDKLAMLKWGWIDLLSSIPTFEFFRYGRAVRIVRLVRLLRVVRTARYLGTVLKGKRRSGTVLYAGLIAMFAIFLGGIGLFLVESDLHAGRLHGEQALWWAFYLLTAGGMENFVPVTTAGHILAALLVLCGMGLFTALAGYLASWFVEEDAKQDNIMMLEIMTKLDRLQNEVSQLREAQERNADEQA